MFPRLTLRGLHTDRLEAFAADHWLTFRGLHAEGLGDCSHEAASFPIRRVGTSGIPGWLPQDGLSWAGLGDPTPMDGLLGRVSARSLHVSRSRETASLAVGGAFSVSPRNPLLACSPRRGAARGLLRAHGPQFRVRPPIFFGRGILGDGTWISDGRKREQLRVRRVVCSWVVCWVSMPAFLFREWDNDKMKAVQLLKPDSNNAGAVVVLNTAPKTILPCQRRVLESVKRIGQVTAVQVRLLVPEPESARTIHPKRGKPVGDGLAEAHRRLLLQPLFQHEPLRRRAPPVRLEREDEHVRVTEVSALFRHSNAVKPTKHIPVRCEPDDRNVPLAPDMVEDPVGSELVDHAVVDDRCTRLPRPLLEGVDGELDGWFLDVHLTWFLDVRLSWGVGKPSHNLLEQTGHRLISSSFPVNGLIDSSAFLTSPVLCSTISLASSMCSFRPETKDETVSDPFATP